MTTLSAVVATDGWDVRHVMSCHDRYSYNYLSIARAKTRHDLVIMHALRIAGDLGFGSKVGHGIDSKSWA